jgi:hypothetical protein
MALASALASGCGQVVALTPDPTSQPVLQLAQGNDIGEGAAAKAAQRATGGRVLGVKRRSTDAGVVYEVKVLMDGGIMRVVRVDGASGQVR